MNTYDRDIFGEMENLKVDEAGNVNRKRGGANGSKPLKHKRSPLRRLWRFVWIALLCWLALSLLRVPLYKFVYPTFTPLMVHRWFEQVKDPDRPVSFERHYVSLEHISPEMVKAVIASEDGRFVYHKGFDVNQLKISYKENKQGRRVRGGSTISMQTAKNAFLPHKRSYTRKAREAAYTMMIEKLWGKERIMEVYLNIIEFGDGIYGVEAASQHYFGHSAETLSRHEAAQLAVIIPSPLKRDLHHPGSFMKRQTGVIEGRMRKMGKVDLTKRPEKRRKEDDQGVFDFLKWVREQEKKK